MSFQDNKISHRRVRHLGGCVESISLFFYVIVKILFLDRVESLEHVIDLLKVVSTRDNGGDITLGGEVLLEVGLVAQVAELLVQLAQPCQNTNGKIIHQLTDSYSVGARARREASLLGMSKTLDISSVLPLIRNEVKLEARPEP